jgi:hypothetical protein
LVAAHAAYPRGRSIHIPFYRFILDPDTFGGEEDREPWAEVVATGSATRREEEGS